MHISRNTNRIETTGAAQPCRLRVIHGPDAGLDVSIPRVGVVVGASASVDVTLNDPSVSGKHCSIRPTNDGFDVRDLESSNGTFLDGVSLKQGVVPAGALIRVGGSILQLVPGEESVAIPPSDADRFGDLVGGSAPMRQIYALLELASRSNASILVLGESGTGKELVARAVHEHSPRKDRPFVVFDCGASSESLIESELFGHVKGAFTGAHADRPGAFELAHGGTLFLDEIGDLPLAVQPKLLRLLEAGEVKRVGAKKSDAYDVRVVAATHRNLTKEVSRGTFRGDLYYRLAVVEIHLPPLRQRLEDVEQLVRVFLEREGRAAGALQSPNLDKLLGYHFPGNVRELRNVIQRAVALSPPDVVFAEMPVLLGPPKAEPGERSLRASADRPFHEAKAELIERFERSYVQDLMRRYGDNISQAARESGIDRKHLYRLLKRTGEGK